MHFLICFFYKISKKLIRSFVLDTNVQTNMAQKVIEMLEFIIINMTDESQYEDFWQEMLIIDNIFEDVEFDENILDAYEKLQKKLYISKGVLSDVIEEMNQLIDTIIKS